MIQALLHKYRIDRAFVGMLILALSPTRLFAQSLQVPPGTKVPVAAIPDRITAPLTLGMGPEAFGARLKAGGTWSLSGGEIELGPADFAHSVTWVLALDTLELHNGARFVTNGNNLVIFANRVVSNDGSIIAFRADGRSAAAGNPGAPGKPGVPGRLVSIHVVDTIVGRLRVDLSGQNGGNGGPGNPGVPGSAGTKGNSASSGPFGCNMGGGNGTPGSPGGAGGAGGDGGNGGAGGILELYNLGAAPLPSTAYDFQASPGQGGKGGPGGVGGPGGPGGEGGNGAGFCNGGQPGPAGPNGPNGPSGHDGSLPNAGDAIVRNIDLEFILQTELPKVAR